MIDTMTRQRESSKWSMGRYNSMAPACKCTNILSPKPGQLRREEKMNERGNHRSTSGHRLTEIPARTPWLAISKLNPLADVRVFCFPYAGGNAMIYRLWPDNLPMNIEVCPIQLPGRGSRLRETPYKRLIPMVESLREV